MRRIKVRYVAAFSLLAALLFMNYVMPLIPGLRSLGASVNVVASGSMSPFLNFGDVVVLTGANLEDIKVGDVIAFNVAPRFQQQYNYPPVVIHRVVEIVSVGYFQTKGDATENDPFTVPASDVVGLYAWKLPYIGLPFLFMRSIYGIVLLASYITVDLAFDYGPIWWKKKAAGIKQVLKNLSNSTTRGATSTQPGATIVMRRNRNGGVELVEASRPVRLTVRRRVVAE